MDENRLDRSAEKPQASTEVPQPAVKAGWVRGLLFLIVYAVFTVIYSIVLMATLAVTDLTDFLKLIDRPIMTLVQALILTATLVLVFLFRRLIDRRSFVSLGLSFEHTARKHLLVGMLWGVAMVSTVFVTLRLLGMISIQSVQFPLGPIVVIAIVMGLAAFQEELVTRGYLLNNFMASMNKYLALLFVSVLFAVNHGFNPNVSLIALSNIVLAGLLLGIYYVHRQNLWFPIGLHFTWNYFQGVIFGSSVSGIDIKGILSLRVTGDELYTGGEFGFEASLVTTLVTLVTIVIIHLKYRSSDSGS